MLSTGGVNMIRTAATQQTICNTVTVARLPVCLIAGLAAAATVWWQSPSELWTQLKILAAITFLTALGFLVNDIVDEQKDRMAGRQDKLIATGRLARAPAMTGALVAMTAAVGIAYSLNIHAFFWSLGMAVLISTYSPFALLFPIAKCIYTSGLCLAPFLFVSLSGLGDFSVRGAVLLCIFIFGREILIDVKDIEYDLRAKFVTLAVRIGAKPAWHLGWTLMLLSTVGLLIASSSTPAMPMALGTMAFVVLALRSSFGSDSRPFLWTRWAMLCAVLALPAIR
jgi:4-hydroxybenzoate polyprenyltransferase